MTKHVQPGDVVLIPLDSAKFAIGKVLYLSQYFKGVILLGIYPQAIFEKTMPALLPEPMSLFVYTSKKAIQQDRWIHVGHERLRENERGLAKRIVGGEVWEDDVHLRPATREDLKCLPQMHVLGAGLVEKRTRQLFGIDESQ
jgi:hypothetical protein